VCSIYFVRMKLVLLVTIAAVSLSPFLHPIPAVSGYLMLT